MDTFLSTSSSLANAATGEFVDDESRWAAVVSRNPTADRAFVYGVLTTKIYCRPICKARLARRSNVLFFTTPREARNSGFRACKRCKPELASYMPEENAVRRIREFVAQPPNEVQFSTVNAMAKHAGVSKWHFYRVFKRVVGMTPSEYIDSRGLLSRPASQTPHIFERFGDDSIAESLASHISGFQSEDSDGSDLNFLNNEPTDWPHFDSGNSLE